MQLKELKLPEKILSILERSGIETLNPPQEEAVKNGLLESKNLVIAAPTASGKTLIAELAFLRNYLNNGKTIYVVPLKALASEKYEEFNGKYQNIGVRVAISVGDFDSREDWLGRYDLIIVTTEKLDSLMRHDSDWIKNVSLVVADEVHMLNDVSRGATLEVVLTRLISMTRSQIIALSATISNADEIAEWLKATLIKSNYRPIKLSSGVFYPEEENFIVEFSDRKHIIKDKHIDSEIILAKDTVNKKKQALLFVSTRRSAEATAEKIGAHIEPLLSQEEKIELKKLAKEIERALHTPTKQCKRLASIVTRGCAFHHAGLMAKQRKLVEDNFKSGLIKILSSTPTLAFGVNLPAYRVLIRDVKRFSSYGSDYIPVMEVHQMMGRSGRPKYDKEGEAIIITKSKDMADDIKERYIHGEPESIYSKLSVEPLLRMHTLALIASGFVRNLSGLEKFYSRTFFAHQYGNLEEVMTRVDKILVELRNYGFIEKTGFISSEFVPAFNIEVDLKATPVGKRVAELYIDPVSAFNIIKNLEPQKEIQYLLTVSQCNEMGHTNVRKSELENIESELARAGINSPDVWDIEYGDFLSSFKSALLLRDWMNEKGENVLMENYGITPGESYTKFKTGEWLFYSASELAIVLGNKDMANQMNKLRLRIKHGIKEELLPLIRLKGIGRVRARMLLKAGMKTLEDVRHGPLENVVGKRIAENIRKQLIEDLDETVRKAKSRRSDTY